MAGGQGRCVGNKAFGVSLLGSHQAEGHISSNKLMQQPKCLSVQCSALHPEVVLGERERER